LGKVFAHLADSSQDYSRSLLSVTRLCSVYRRANVFEKTFQYTRLQLGILSSALMVPGTSRPHIKRHSPLAAARPAGQCACYLGSAALHFQSQDLRFRFCTRAFHGCRFSLIVLQIFR
jgi:hypothetical protein